MPIRLVASFAVTLLLAGPTSAVAAELPPDVLTQSDRATIRQADFNAELENVPPASRAEFVANATRVSKMINSMLETKTLAAEARANGLDKDPSVQQRVAVAIDRALAVARAEQIEREAAAAFERRREEFVSRAREIYLTNKAKFARPEQVRADHILVRTEKRGNEEALKLALEIRAKAMQSGADFAALAREYSEDPTAKSNGGNLGWFSAAQMEPRFSAAAFALTKPGEISEPVLTSFGYHIIRLNERKAGEIPTFEAVRESVLDDVKREYITTQKNAATDGIFRDPTLKLNQAAIDGLVGKYDSEAVKRAGSVAGK